MQISSCTSLPVPCLTLHCQLCALCLLSACGAKYARGTKYAWWIQSLQRQPPLPVMLPLGSTCKRLCVTEASKPELAVMTKPASTMAARPSWVRPQQRPNTSAAPVAQTAVDTTLDASGSQARPVNGPANQGAATAGAARPGQHNVEQAKPGAETVEGAAEAVEGAREAVEGVAAGSLDPASAAAIQQRDTASKPAHAPTQTFHKPLVFDIDDSFDDDMLCELEREPPASFTIDIDDDLPGEASVDAAAGADPAAPASTAASPAAAAELLASTARWLPSSADAPTATAALPTTTAQLAAVSAQATAAPGAAVYSNQARPASKSNGCTSPSLCRQAGAAHAAAGASHVREQHPMQLPQKPLEVSSPSLQLLPANAMTVPDTPPFSHTSHVRSPAGPAWLSPMLTKHLPGQGRQHSPSMLGRPPGVHRIVEPSAADQQAAAHEQQHSRTITEVKSAALQSHEAAHQGQLVPLNSPDRQTSMPMTSASAVSSTNPASMTCSHSDGHMHRQDQAASQLLAPLSSAAPAVEVAGVQYQPRSGPVWQAHLPASSAAEQSQAAAAARDVATAPVKSGTSNSRLHRAEQPAASRVAESMHVVPEAPPAPASPEIPLAAKALVPSGTQAVANVGGRGNGDANVIGSPVASGRGPDTTHADATAAASATAVNTAVAESSFRSLPEAHNQETCTMPDADDWDWQQSQANLGFHDAFGPSQGFGATQSLSPTIAWAPPPAGAAVKPQPQIGQADKPAGQPKVQAGGDAAAEKEEGCQTEHVPFSNRRVALPVSKPRLQQRKLSSVHQPDAEPLLMRRPHPTGPAQAQSRTTTASTASVHHHTASAHQPSPAAYTSGGDLTTVVAGQKAAKPSAASGSHTLSPAGAAVLSSAAGTGASPAAAIFGPHIADAACSQPQAKKKLCLRLASRQPEPAAALSPRAGLDSWGVPGPGAIPGMARNQSQAQQDQYTTIAAATDGSPAAAAAAAAAAAQKYGRQHQHSKAELIEPVLNAQRAGNNHAAAACLDSVRSVLSPAGNRLASGSPEAATPAGTTIA